MKQNTSHHLIGSKRNFGNAINTYRKARWCYLHHLKPLAKFLRSWIYLIHNSYIPYTADIGEGTLLGYKGMAVIIHADAVIGRNCDIGSCVTIGGGAGDSNKRISEFDAKRRTLPVLGDRVSVSTGAKVLGSVVGGDDVIIGANAVVLSDVPDRAVVVGVPAKVVRIRSQEECENE